MLHDGEYTPEMEILLLASTMVLVLWITSVVAKAVASPANRKERRATLSARVENIADSEKG